MQTAEASVVLGRYRLVRRLGAGGFGVVFLAHDEKLDRQVAVKRIILGDSATAARAAREAKAAARLSHPGIVALFEAGRDDEAVYLVSELVDGRSLAELEAEGLLSDRDVLRAGIALCDALGHAHRRGVVHRDVKPANVLVPDEPAEGPGVVKLTDFGVAHMVGDDALTATGDVVGTLAYMAPEQAEGRGVDWRADLYALGLLLFEALAGINPVRARGAAATARRVGARLPPLGRLRRDLPLQLCAAIDAAVATRPEDRGTLKELRTALAAALPAVGDEAGTIAGSPVEGLPIVGAAGRPHPRRRRIRPRERLLAGAAAGVLASAAVAFAGPGGTTAPQAAVAAGAAGVVVALLPALGWALAAGALVGWVATATSPGLAAVLAAAALPALPLLRGAPGLRSAPAAAPLLGLAALAVAWPAAAGQAPRAVHRAALAALGCWWCLLLEVATGRRLVLGAPADALPLAAWRDSAGGALTHAVWPALTGGALLVGLAWALGAAVLPLVVRGRVFALDLVAAAAWAAGTAGCAQALARTLPATTAGQSPPEVRGLVAGAVLSGVLAVAAGALRPRDPARDAA